jgi:hypothetical protein
VAITCIAFSVGTTESNFTNQEQTIDNSYGAWTSILWTQTTQSDFEAGTLTNVSPTISPGDVTLASPSDWYDSDWSYRRKIIIDHTRVDNVSAPSTAYAEFPVLVYVTGLSDTHIGVGGADIRFTASDGVTELPREIESYSAGTLYAWVKVTLTKDASDSTNDSIYMYYGNTAASEPAPDSTYGSEKVWDSDYIMVQHLKESPNGTAYEMKDSTSNDNHGTTVGGMDSSDSVNAKVGKGLDLDGVDGAGGDHISVPNSNSLNGTVDEGTWSMWINWDDWGSEQKVIMAIADRYTVPYDGYEWGAQPGFPDGNLFAYPWARGSNYNLNTSTNFTNGTWHYISVRYDWTSRTLTMNLDGNDLNNNILNVGAANWTQQAAIDAAWLWGGSPQRDTRFIDARIDEIQVSDVSRSLNWITTSYNNQNNPSTFCSVGNEYAMYVPSGKIASQVKDTAITGARWDALEWDEVLAGGTDITFEVRAADTSFVKDNTTLAWTSLGGTSPVYAGLPSGRYFQWRATLTTADTAVTPTLNEVRAFYT